MPAARNLSIYQGDTYSHTVTFQDGTGAALDVSGVTFTASIETTAGAATASFTVGTGSAASGIITLSLSSSTTGGITAGDYVWDLQGVSGGATTTYLAGRVRVRGQVT